jgi:hypothetical protein
MGLKVWSVGLVFSLLLLIFIGYLSGLLSSLNLLMLLCVLMILFVAYIMLTRKDPMTKIPTPLELEKIKRRRYAEESGIRSEPDEKL